MLPKEAGFSSHTVQVLLYTSVSFLLFLLFLAWRDLVWRDLGLPAHLSEHKLRRERSAYEELTLDKLLADSDKVPLSHLSP